MMLPTVIMTSAAYTAFASSEGFTVDKLSYTADLRSDGSALITEEWTLTFDETGADGFDREIDIIDDNFERISGISDMSVSVDGNICSEESSDSLRKGTYTFAKTADAYFISWYMPSKNETRVFSMRYIVSDAVKLYNERAYFYCRAVNENSGRLCKNVTVTVNTPVNCFSEDFEIIESGSLAGEKSDGHVTFFTGNSVGLVKIGITMPQSVFDTESLTLIVDDNTSETAVCITAAVILLLFAVLFIIYICNYKKIFTSYWKRKRTKKAGNEASYTAREQTFKRFGPAEIINTVTESPPNRADLFIVTLLDLVRRGYITASKDGFSASEISDSDEFLRPLNKNEKRVIKIFSSERWKRLIKSPESFYKEVESFNRSVGYIPPSASFSPSARKYIGYCFDMVLSARDSEFIPPEEISDDFFGRQKYNVSDLVISLISEYERTDERYKKAENTRFKRDMFMFRQIYDEGKALTESEKEDTPDK